MIENDERLVKQDLFIKKLKEGNESAYEVLFKTFYTELVIHANRYLYDIESAKEVVQDLIVTIYEKRSNLDINSSLKSYLYRSVQNRCINHINSKKTKDKYATYVSETSGRDENLIETEMNLAELENALYTAIGELPPKCRMIFKMNRFEGYSNTEIASRLELSKRTVETQISNALKLLRSKLQPYLQGVYLWIIAIFLV